MFSGIIETTGSVVAVEEHKGDRRITFSCKLKAADVKTGDSISVNGVCLTIIDYSGDQFTVDVSAETLSCTTFAGLKKGNRVNIERALKISDRLHGHIVTGHIDGVATIIERTGDARSDKIVLECPSDLMSYISRKGSVCIDGVSLTVNEKKKDCFAVNIIPHTLKETIIGEYRVGSKVNIEVDIIARYLESLTSPA